MSHSSSDKFTQKHRHAVFSTSYSGYLLKKNRLIVWESSYQTNEETAGSAPSPHHKEPVCMLSLLNNTLHTNTTHRYTP